MPFATCGYKYASFSFFFRLYMRLLYEPRSLTVFMCLLNCCDLTTRSWKRKNFYMTLQVNRLLYHGSPAHGCTEVNLQCKLHGFFFRNECRMEGFVIYCSRTLSKRRYSPNTYSPVFHYVFSYKVFSRNICVFSLRVACSSVFTILDSFVITLAERHEK